MLAAYTRLLTPDERLAAFRFGMLTKFAELGYFNEKSAGVNFYFNPLDAAAKTVVVVSFLTGVPVGVLAHYISKQVNRAREKEYELHKKIDYFTNATEQLAAGLNAGANKK